MRDINTPAAFMLSAAAGAMLTGQHAWAQNVAVPASSRQSDTADQDITQGVGEIIVTARRRAENLQSTPLAISAISAQTLEQRDIVSLVDLSRLAPSFKVEQIPGGVGSVGAATGSAGA